MAKHVELFYFPMSYYSMKVRIYLAEKGIKPELHVINLRKDENLSDEFLRLNPEGEVPVIRVEGYSVSDSEAIMKHGEMNFSGPSLAPSEIKEEVWNLHDEIHGLRADIITFGTFFRPENFAKDYHPPAFFVQKVKGFMASNGGVENLRKKKSSAPSDLAACLEQKIQKRLARVESIRSDEQYNAEMEKVSRVLDMCESKLAASGPLLFGDSLTVADIDLAVLYLRLRLLNLDSRYFSVSRPGLQRFLETMRKRDSFLMVEKESSPSPMVMMTLHHPVLIGALVCLVIGVGIAIWRRR